MLASLGPGQFDEAVQYYQLEPWGDDWERSSMIAAVVSDAVRAAVATFAGNSEPLKLTPTDQYVPWRAERRTEQELAAELDACDSIEGL
jgi:hypothetical protein